ncbi:MAG: helix-turn-helix domain-containing protein [Opitutales bacterium]
MQKPEFISKQVEDSEYIFIPEPSAPSDGYSVVCAGKETCTKDFLIDRKGFEYVAIELITSGKFELVVEGEKFDLYPGSIFAYNSSTHFTLKAIGNISHRKYFIDFSGRNASHVLEMSGLCDNAPKVVSRISGLRDVFNLIIACNTYPADLAQRLCNSLSDVLLLKIREDARSSKSVQHVSFETYLRCHEYINLHFRTIKSAEEVASACNLSAAYMTRLFKKHSRDAPHATITKLKIEHAASEILATTIPIKQAASRVGYDDPYHFTRVFKSHYGIPPQQFIKRFGRNLSR